MQYSVRLCFPSSLKKIDHYLELKQLASMDAWFAVAGMQFVGGGG